MPSAHSIFLIKTRMIQFAVHESKRTDICRVSISESGCKREEKVKNEESIDYRCWKLYRYFIDRYLKENYPDKYEVDTVDMLDGSWRQKSFGGYDSVFHVAGIAHSDNGKISEEMGVVGK